LRLTQKGIQSARELVSPRSTADLTKSSNDQNIGGYYLLARQVIGTDAGLDVVIHGTNDFGLNFMLGQSIKELREQLVGRGRVLECN
jgi:hypothetical protein